MLYFLNQVRQMTVSIVVAKQSEIPEDLIEINF